MITVYDIQNKEFTKALTGYNSKEVDEFLDLITIDYNSLLNDNKGLRNKVLELDEELKAKDEEIASLKKNEKTVAQTLDKAQDLLEGISSGAEKRADLLLKNAELDAKRIQEEAYESVEKLTKESARLNENIDKFKEAYKKLLTEELEKLSTQDIDILNLLAPSKDTLDSVTIPKIK